MVLLKSSLALCAAAYATLVYSVDVHYEMDLTWEEGAPDGNPRYMIFNNGQFPGPDVIADEGDEVEAKPGESFVYRWIASPFGTYCCVDSVLIQGKGNVDCLPAEELDSLVNPALRFVLNGTKVTDKGCIPPGVNTQGDYHATNLYDLVPLGMNEGCKPSSGGPLAAFEVNARDQWASLNFINGASLKALSVSIDEHPMWVYAIDGEYIMPKLVHNFHLFNGARISVMVKLDKPPGNYSIRAVDQGGDQIIAGFATLSYKNGKDNGPSKPYVDYGGTNTTADVISLGLEYVAPFLRDPPSLTADQTFHLSLGRINSSWQWTLDGTKLYPSDRGAYNPLLFDPHQPDGKDSALTITTYNNTWVDIIMHVQFNSHNPLQPPHIIHKHSNKAYMIATNLGRFNWTTVAEAQKVIPEQFNIEGAPFRDTFVTDPTGESWMVLRYHVMNPGPFLLHCHIETHLEGGMAVAMLDGIDAWPTDIPEEYQI
ncbi:MAG: hypothetical protein Q9187_002328 [Circinaria calcarea]